MTFIPTINHTSAATRFEGNRKAKATTIIQLLDRLLKSLFRSSGDWRRLNEHLLRDIGKTPADAEFEEFSKSVGSSTRVSIENSRDGRML